MEKKGRAAIYEHGGSTGSYLVVNKISGTLLHLANWLPTGCSTCSNS